MVWPFYSCSLIEYQMVQLPANADTVDAMLCLEYVKSASFFMLYKANREKKLLHHTVKERSQSHRKYRNSPEAYMNTAKGLVLQTTLL